MPYIWNNPDWPMYTYDKAVVDRHYRAYEMQKIATDTVFSIIDPDLRGRMHARALADEIHASLAIEAEKISYESVYSSICKRLDITFKTKAKHDQYAESISILVFDATGNLEPLTIDRIMEWHSLLFSSLAGRKPKHIGSYRQGPVYITNTRGRNSESIYEGLPVERISQEMEKLIEFINTENETKPLVKGAIAAFWFLCIHPFEDGNGRISRAISDYILSKGFHQTYRDCSMSALILKYRNEYYHLLQEQSAQATSLDLTSWLTWTIELAIKAKQEALDQFQKSMKLTRFMMSLDPSLYNSRQITMLFKLADGSLEGKLSTDKWAKMNKCSPAAASRDIQQLLQAGFLVPSGETGPQTGYYLAQDLVDDQ